MNPDIRVMLAAWGAGTIGFFVGAWSYRVFVRSLIRSAFRDLRALRGGTLAADLNPILDAVERLNGGPDR